MLNCSHPDQKRLLSFLCRSWWSCRCGTSKHTAGAPESVEIVFDNADADVDVDRGLDGFHVGDNSTANVVDNAATSDDDAGDDSDNADADDEVVVKIELTMALGNILGWIATIVCKRETGKEGNTRPKSAMKTQFGENSEI